MMSIGVKLSFSPPTDDGETTETLSVDTDGTLRINPYFFNPLDRFSKMGVLVHELDHLLLDHPQEMMKYENKLKCNVAMDLGINSFNRLLPFFKYSSDDIEKMSKGEMVSEYARKQLKDPRKAYGLHPRHFGFPEGLTTRQYYDLLPDKEEELKKKLLIMGMGVPGPGCADQNASVSGLGKLRQKLDAAVQKAEAKANAHGGSSRGLLPGSFKARLGEINKRSEMSWKQILRQYAKSFLLGERGLQYKKPDRRTDLIPGRLRLKKSVCFVAIDTSGSTMGFRKAFGKEIDAIWQQTKAKMYLIECDAEVQKDHYEFKGKMPESLEGNGGTAFTPVFEYIKDKKLPCTLLIYLTDGYGERPSKPDYINYPVLWVTTQIDPASWGKIIKIDSPMESLEDA